MAEGIGIKYLKNYIFTSAGTSPEPVNQYAINSMKEIEIDISNHKSKAIDMNEINNFDLVITLCGDAKDKCVLVNTDKHIHWNIPDPAKYHGTKEEVKNEFSRIRNMIYNHIMILKKN